MNISAICPIRFSNNNNYNKPIIKNAVGFNSSSSFKGDTVSFGMRGLKLATNTMGDIMANQVKNDTERFLSQFGTQYLNVLEAIANKLKQAGVSFERVYCERNVIKSPDGTVDKRKRSRKFTVPDQIRATIYSSNIYDLSILNDVILPELEDNGYYVANADKTLQELMERGYVPTGEEISAKEISVPDIDIRLKNVSGQITKLNPEYRYSIGKPKDSGYEDIQIRLYQPNVQKNKQVQHELLIITGPAYARAKHYESHKIYEYTRKFSELNFIKNGNAENKYVKSAVANIEHIVELLNLEISRKLFTNAKNKDLKKDVEELSIKVSKDEIEKIEKSFEFVRSLIDSYYDGIISRAKKGSSIERLHKLWTKDIDDLLDIQKELLKSIKFFNAQGHKKDPYEHLYAKGTHGTHTNN